jgi:transposase
VLSGAFNEISGMPQNFIACDRGQAFLLPPSLLEWVPEDHLVWTILAAVDELELTAIYDAYRPDGHGRPAYEPRMVVALLLYSYAKGIQSSREIERKCREDVAFMVIAALATPDHSTIAEFRRRHEQALAELFTGVLGLCRKAGLVKVGLLAVDGMKLRANASQHSNRDYRRIAEELLADAERVDREEDERFGKDRGGDELPEQLRTRKGRQAVLRQAKLELDSERDEQPEEDPPPADDEDSGPGLELDVGRLMAGPEGRRGWIREARDQLDEHRAANPRPVPRSRRERLVEGKRLLEEEHQVLLDANAAYEAYRARGVMKDGRRFGRPPDPFVGPPVPEGLVNISDPDSRNLKCPRGYKQGYNAQAVVNEQQIVIAAEINTDSPDFGHLEPMIGAARRQLKTIGIFRKPEVVVADAGYWHNEQMDQLAASGIPLLIPPDAGKRKTARPGWQGGRYTWMRYLLATENGHRLYRKRQVTVEPVFGQTVFNRKLTRFYRRGHAAVHSEWRLIASTHNLLKLHSHRIATAGP